VDYDYLPDPETVQLSSKSEIFFVGAGDYVLPVEPGGQVDHLAALAAKRKVLAAFN